MVDTQPTIIADAIIGRTIGNDVVQRLLGQGGMDSVYFAEHPTIGKRIALGVLHAEFAVRSEIVNRFFNEAKAVSDIQHPNIIDFATLPPISPADPSFVYFFMEYIEGTSITDLIAREGPLPLREPWRSRCRSGSCSRDTGRLPTPGQLLMWRAANGGADARTTPRWSHHERWRSVFP